MMTDTNEGGKNKKINNHISNFNSSKMYDLWVKSDRVTAMICKFTIRDKPNIHELGWD